MNWRIFICCVLTVFVACWFSGCGSTDGSSNSSAWAGLTGSDLRSGTPLSIQVIPGTSQVTTGNPFVVVIRGYDSYGRPITDSTGLTVTSKIGAVTNSTLSFSKGYATANYTAGTTPGVETITAFHNGMVGSATLTVTSASLNLPRVRMVCVPDQVVPGGTAFIVVFVTNAGGVPTKAGVKLLAAKGGTFAASTGDSTDGVFTTTYTASTSAGIDQITAVADGGVGTATLAVIP